MNFSPTQLNERISSLDLLRGFAVLGILIMNIQSFSMPGAAYINPFAYGDMSGANKWVWILSHVFADQKFMTIFSILFGAGIMLMCNRAGAKGMKPGPIHYRRNFWLLLIGLIHAYLIWYGDILVTYALCGFLAYLFRKMKPRALVFTGLLIISMHTLIYALFGFSMPEWPEEARENILSIWLPSAESISAEIAAITGTLSEQLEENFQGAMALQTWVFFLQTFWRATGNMLIGMALFKMGVITGEKSSDYYKKGALVGSLIGFPIIIYGLIRNFQAGFSWDYSMYLGSQFNYWGSLFVAFAYICLVMLFAKTDSFAGLKERFQAVGQMAFSNYLSQSVICVLIFFGIGFGLFGQVERTTQILIVPVIWLLQFFWSHAWLSRYRYGPMEWLWRTLTYWKPQPMRIEN